MAEHLGPSSIKKPRISSPSLNTPSDSGEFSFSNFNFEGIVNDLPDDLDGLQGSTNDAQTSHGGQDMAMAGSLSQLLSRSTPNSQSPMSMAFNTAGGMQTNRNPGMGMMNMGMGKNQLTTSLAATLMNSNKVATSSHMGVGNGIVSNASYSMSGTNSGMMDNVGNPMGMRSMGTQQMIGGVGSLNMGQQVPNQMMNGMNNFAGNMGQMRGMQGSVNPSTSLPVVQTGMMPDPGMGQMQSHQGMPGHPGMNLQQNSTHGVRPGQQQQQQAAGTMPGPGPRQATADPDKSKLIQQQLVLLLHAHKCQRREQANGDQDCKLPYCRTMKNVLNHMTTCNKGKSCEVAHCASSRQIITHWKNCTRVDCPVCLPLKTADKHNNAGPNVGHNVPAAVPNPQSSNVTDQVTAKRAESLGLQYNQPAASHNAAPQRRVQMNTMSNDGQFSIPNLQNQNDKMLPNLASSNQIGNLLMSLPTSQVPPAIQPQSGSQLANSAAQAAALGSAPDIVKSVPPTNRKDWHAQVTQDLRNHLVHKLVQAIFPTPDPAALRDSRMKNLVAYARKVEGDMYETANNRGEYYHLLAEKIYKIQKELEEKRIQRMKGMNVQNAQVGNVGIMAPQIRPLTQNGMNGTQLGNAMFKDLNSTQPPPQQSSPLRWNLNMQTSSPTGQMSNANTSNNQMSVNAALAESAQQFDALKHTLSQQSAGRFMMPTSTISSTHPSPQQQQQQQQHQQQQQQQQQGLHQQLMSQPQVVQVQVSNQHSVMSNSQMQSAMQSRCTSSVTDMVGGNGQVMGGMEITSGSTMDSVLAHNGVHMNNSQQSLFQQLSTSAASATTPADHSTHLSLSRTPQSSVQISCKEMNNDHTLGSDGICKQETVSKDSGACENSQNLSSLLLAASPSTLSLSAVTPTISVASSTTSTMLSSPAVKVEVKSEPPSDWKPDCNLKEERMDVTAESSCKAEVSSVKEENSSSVMKLESAGENSQASSIGEEKSSPADVASGVVSTAKPRCKKVFDPDELRQALMPVWEKIQKQDPESLPFQTPVDPIALQIPDYFEIVKKPMDLQTIRNNLDSGVYKDPWEFVDDMWLMIDNAWLYNKKTSRVHKYASKLAEVFEAEIDSVMESLGYCCGHKYVFCPQVLCCYGKQLCTIPRDAMYYSYQNRYVYCEKCFQEIQTEEVELSEDPTQPVTKIRKDQFERVKNDQLDYEPFVDCLECGRKWHQICALWFESIWREGWTCDACLKAKGAKRKENRFMAKRLPTTKLGTFLENRINGFLRKKDTQCGEVTIRVLSSYEKHTEVKPLMRKRFGNEMAEYFPYRAKALFAFEEIDGVDVCFFGMHVQEYGSSCPMPNTRRVYISYLDSVHFFRPKQLRTVVYHEILIGYLEYAKNLGYTTAHIWACPPSEGDDYIFHCHPPEQKIPKPKRLQEWYKKMLEKAILDRVVVDCKDILKDAIDGGLSSAKDMAYFDGDFWPNVMEESIMELDQEEEERRKREEAEAAEADAQDPIEETNDEVRVRRLTRTRQMQGRTTARLICLKGTNDLTAKLYSHMDKHKEVFFIIRLHNQQIAASLPPISDPDPPMNCDLMDGRDAFLTSARDKHYEFSSLRRAKFSSIALLYELHNQGKDAFVYTCNVCNAAVETRYHCNTCDDFDLCMPCYKKGSHHHEMIKLGLGLDDIGSSGKEENPQESRRKSIQRCISSLVHACQCKNANCRINACHKMKRVVAHTLGCKRRANHSCPICKQMIALCCYHAKHCTENKCPVPFCPQLKQKLRQKQLLTNLHQAQMLRRRVAIMTDQANSINAHSGGASSASSSKDSSPLLSSSSSPFSSGSSGKVSGPPRGALIAAHDAQLQAEKQRQATAPVISSIGKGKPTMQPPVRPSPASLGPSAGKPMVSAQKPWSPYYSQMPQQQQQQQQQQQPRTALVTGMMPGMQQTHPQQQQPQQQSLQQQQLPPMDVNAVSTSTMSVSGGASGASALGPVQMLQAIKHQNLTQADWVAVIKKNPQLMAQVLKLKNQKIMQQQQQQQQQTTQNQQQQMQKQLSQMMPQQYRQQQMQAQQQTSQMNQFAQPQQPFVQARMNFQQTFQNDAGHSMHQYQQQQHMLQHHQAQFKQQMAGGQPMSPQFMMAQQTSPSPQQMLQQVRSPPISAAMLPQTVRSPQPIPSPRQQPIPSPHHNMVNNQSPLHGLSLGQDTSQYTNDHVMMSSLQTHNSYSQMSSLDMNMGQQDEVAPLTPQDQLAHYVNQM
ncbi:unnamed protein product [Candidula unifasciata]|uniref:histone acetyltransferase n=1 Tax=Candidula unifasciata TaxID=100452 RepID=A0A8S3Z4M7_9EUPU|nr:unnamed protein product [Candidula unifasciata]